MHFLRAAILLTVFHATAAAADEAQLYCNNCAPLPADLQIDLSECLCEAPLIDGLRPKQVLTLPGSGRMLALRAQPPARIWIAVSGEGLPYVAVFEGESKRAAWCRTLGNFEEVGSWGGNYQSVPTKEGLRAAWVSSFARPGGCGSLGADAKFGWLALTKKWQVLTTTASWASRCDDDSAPAPSNERATLYAAGLKAFRAKDFKTAETKWRAALPFPDAIADLGFLLAEQKRSQEAEPFLLDAAITNFRPASWLNLGDLYWDANEHARARVAYGHYLTQTPKPAARAVERSRTTD